MGDTSIRLSNEAKTRLELSKREGESFNDVIFRLTNDENDKWNGFGALADKEGSTRDGMKQIREEMSSGMNIDVEEMGLSEDGEQ